MPKLPDIGLHFITGISSFKLSAKEKTILKELSPAGIIIFANNIVDDNKADSSWQSILLELISEAKELSGRKNFIVSLDHEGGKVHRLPLPSTCFPEGCSWKDSSSKVAEAMAKELKELGFNLNFAPVLDIHSEEKNPVIGKRALATTAEEVSKYGLEFFNALEKEGVRACGKHFPGHGATTSDSHLELPYLELSKEELLKREIIPFRDLIENGLNMIMTAHVVYKKIDPENPATLSSLIINGLLRNELNYQGLVITDALEMKAMDQEKPVQNSLKALNAGVDLLLIGQDKKRSPLEVSLDIAEGLVQALKSQPELEDTLAVSKQRISKYLKELPENTTGSNACSDSLIGCPEHKKLADLLINKNQQA